VDVENVQMLTLLSTCRHYGESLLSGTAVHNQQNTAARRHGDVWKPACISKEQNSSIEENRWSSSEAKGIANGESKFEKVRAHTVPL